MLRYTYTPVLLGYIGLLLCFLIKIVLFIGASVGVAVPLYVLPRSPLSFLGRSNGPSRVRLRFLETRQRHSRSWGTSRTSDISDISDSGLQ